MASIIFRTTNDRTKMPLEDDLEKALQNIKEKGEISFFVRWLLNYAWNAGAREEYEKGVYVPNKTGGAQKPPGMGKIETIKVKQPKFVHGKWIME